MRHKILAVGGAAMAVAVLAIGAYVGWAAERPARAASGGGVGRIPVVVELFTSEGCSSCPPADAALAKYARGQSVPGVQVIALGEHVDYWDRLGWKDPFSSAQFSQRQSVYSNALRLSEVYTPQVIVDGNEEFLGSDEERLRDAITRAAAAPRARVTLRSEAGGRYTVTATDLPGGALPEPGEKVEVYAAVTEDGLTSSVARGENAGRRLSHAAVVRRLERIGIWDAKGQPEYRGSFSAPGKPRQHVVVFLQAAHSRQIVGAAEAG